MALRAAKIAQFNLVRVSSIFPPNCRLVTVQEGGEYLRPGEVVHCVLSSNETNEPHRLIAASIGLAIPRDTNKCGYLAEHHSFGETDDKAGEYAEDLAASMLATILGIDFDQNTSYDERKDIWRLSNEIVVTRNITQSAIGDKEGLWTSVVAGAVLIP